MTIYGVLFRLFGWLLALGLITGELTYYSDGHHDGSMMLAGFAILGLWAWMTLPILAALASPAPHDQRTATTPPPPTSPPTAGQTSRSFGAIPSWGRGDHRQIEPSKSSLLAWLSSRSLVAGWGETEPLWFISPNRNRSQVSGEWVVFWAGPPVYLEDAGWVRYGLNGEALGVVNGYGSPHSAVAALDAALRRIGRPVPTWCVTASASVTL